MRLNPLLFKNIYTTGLTGFVGKNLLPLLLESYDQIINFQRDDSVTIYTSHSEVTHKLSKALTSENPADDMVHLATLYDPNPSSLADLESLIKSNVYFIINILENYVSQEKLTISNICSYTQLLNKSAQNSYSLSKEIVNSYLKSNNFKIKNIYLFDTFGKGDARNKVTDIFIMQALKKEKIVISHNDIEINLSCVDDVAESINNSLKLKPGNYSIFSPNTIKLNELALMIGRLIKSEVKIERKGLGINHDPSSINLPLNIFNKKKHLLIEDQLLERINELKRT